ncbi:Arc family DNA-binding protein [Falsihalocynthiibacter arcticus]|uniref:Arc-like DNA binding domain-containing protein n=1 Tax=Falsihalocynthiibacter arcticus TaxID=1579316 RepID=A0A126V2E4_9RHOB|nr:Arc family DNA-binding protein [Falsihalocynthiibacter arcticus]AML52484.1 hypothetical protein RC74_15470 [Falsihalocynthiibacter arcticus]
MTKPPVSEQVQVNFRMPKELQDKCKTAAGKNGRSMNAEKIFALEKYFGEIHRNNDSRDEVTEDQLGVEPKRNSTSTDEEGAQLH